MDSFEFNKLAGGLLGSLLFAMSLGAIADFIYLHPEPAVAGYELPEPPPPVTGPQMPPEPLPNLLALADVTKGEADARPCTSCHNFDKGAGPKIGPPLYGVLGRPVASVAGFQYSDALKSKGGDWTFDTINTFITNPKAYAPGTKMTFTGESDPARRAAILVYLRSLSDDPVPLPAKVAEPVMPTVAGAAPPPSLPELLAKADPKRGESDMRVCSNCHNLEKGAAAKIGPPLYGVVDRPVASVADFDYSEAMKAKGGSWTYDALFTYLADPRSVVKGTKMTFSGEPSPTRRADILAYLQTLADTPVPFPAVPAPVPVAAAAGPAAAPDAQAAPQAAPASSPAQAPAAAGQPPAPADQAK